MAHLMVFEVSHPKNKEETLVFVPNIIRNLEVIDPTLAASFRTYAAGQPDINDFIPFLKQISPDGDDNVTHYWDYLGVAVLWANAPHEALVIHWEHYQLLLTRQEKSNTRIHKRAPLVRLSDCFRLLGFKVHEKRYLMLTL